MCKEKQKDKIHFLVGGVCLVDLLKQFEGVNQAEFVSFTCLCLLGN